MFRQPARAHQRRPAWPCEWFRSVYRLVWDFVHRVTCAGVEQRAVTDFFQQSYHQFRCWGGFPGFGSKTLAKTAKNNPADKPHIRMPVSASTAPTQTPLLRQHEVTIARSGVGHRAKIECRLQVGHPMLPCVEKSPDDDLDEMHQDRTTRDANQHPGGRPEALCNRCRLPPNP